MGQRQRTTPQGVREFKYLSVIECEENEDQHVAKPRSWPPRRQGNQTGDPSMALRCELCNCHLVVYKGHATGDMPGIKVDLSLVQAQKAKVTA